MIQNNSNAKIKASIVGCGNISGKHLSAISSIPYAEIVSVCDVNKERARLKASEFGAKAFYDFNEMILAGGFDVLHICTPHYLHYPMALKAIERDVNVLSEKPPAIRYDDALDMCEKAREKGVLLGTCFQNRFNQSSVYIKNAINNGELGSLKTIKGFVTWRRDESYYRSDDWHGSVKKEGGSLVINQAIHTLDLMEWFAGSDAESVKASVSTKKLNNVIETEDTADALIRFKNGVEGVFFGTLCYGENSPVFIELLFEKGKITLYDDLTVLREGERPKIIELQKSKGEKSYWGNSHNELIENFYDCIISGKNSDILYESGVKVMDIIDRIYDKAR